MILTLRTDNPQAEIGLFDNSGTQIAYESWQAHRLLAETIHTKIHSQLTEYGKDWGDISGIVLFRGPGSFTGLRIGATVANSLASNLGIPVVGCVSDDWQGEGIGRLNDKQNDFPVLPHYGREPHITKQTK